MTPETPAPSGDDGRYTQMVGRGLRPYQGAALAQVRDAFDPDGGPAVVTLPRGTGKADAGEAD